MAHLSAAARRAAASSTQSLSTAATPLLSAAAASSTPVAAAAATTSRGAAVTSIECILRSAAAHTIGRRAVSCPASLPIAATRTCGFSSSVLGNRSYFSAPTYLATGGSLIARRGIASQPGFSPELKRELQRMEDDSLARHQEIAKRFMNFQLSTKKEHALLQVGKANRVLENARVGWSIVYGSLAAAALGIWFALHTKSLWIRDFKIFALTVLTELVVKLKLDLEKQMKEIIREEVEKDMKD